MDEYYLNYYLRNYNIPILKNLIYLSIEETNLIHHRVNECIYRRCHNFVEDNFAYCVKNIPEIQELCKITNDINTLDTYTVDRYTRYDYNYSYIRHKYVKNMYMSDNWSGGKLYIKKYTKNNFMKEIEDITYTIPLVVSDNKNNYYAFTLNFNEWLSKKSIFNNRKVIYEYITGQSTILPFQFNDSFFCLP